MMYGHVFGDTEGSDFECHTSTRSGQLVCSGLTASEDDTIFALQHNINRAAKAAGLSQSITEDGIIGPLTVGLAQAVMASSFAQNIVGQVQDAGAIVDARSMAANAGSFVSLFDQVAGTTQVSTTSPSTAKASRQSEGVTKPIPPATEARLAAGSSNTGIFVGIGAGVVLIGLVAAVAYNQRKKRVGGGKKIPPKKMRAHKPTHRRFFRRAGRRPVDIEIRA